MPYPALEGIKFATVDAGKADEQWVYALSLGRTLVRNDGEKVFLDVTEELALKVLAETRKAMAEFDALAKKTDTTPFRFPVLQDHQRVYGEFGSIIDTRFRGAAEEKPGIWLKVAWNPRFSHDVFSRVSVGIMSSFDTQEGKTFGPVIGELSLTSYPRDTRIGTLAETVATSFSLALVEDNMDPEQLQALILEALAPMSEAIAKLQAQVAELQPNKEDAPAEPAPAEAALEVAASVEPVEEPAEPAEPAEEPNAELTAMLASLTESMQALKADNDSLRQAVLSRPVSKEGIKVPEPKAAITDIEELAKSAKEAGIGRGAAFLSYASMKGYDLSNYNEDARRLVNLILN